MVELPEWSAFDASAAPVLPEHAERPGRLVAVVATKRAREDGWAMEAVVGIARAWSESGRKVVLADTALADATLHECLDVDNAEGVTDTVVFGSSVRRIAKRSDKGAFFVITAGTASADPGAVLASERWERLSRGFVEAGVTLVSYVGAESDGKTAILGLATDVVVLAEPAEDAGSVVDGSVAPVRAVIGRPSTNPSATPLADSRVDVADPLAAALEGTAGEVDDRAEEGDARAHGTDATLPEDMMSAQNVSSSEKMMSFDDSSLPEDALSPKLAALPEAEASIVEAPKRSVAPAATGSRRLVLLAVTLIVLLIVGAAALGWINIPGISPQNP